MAAQVMPPSPGANFLDSPVYTRSRPPPSEFSPLTNLQLDSSDTEVALTYTPHQASQLNTPDSGFSGPAASTPLKTPESEATTPVSAASGQQRKRKTVTIDESQTSVVVISSDQGQGRFSRSRGESHDLRDDLDEADELDTRRLTDINFLDSGLNVDSVNIDSFNVDSAVLDSLTGWPLLRSESLESRDNPFLPGGELCREAEDLLSRATIIRDNFYLNQAERRTLHQQQAAASHQYSLPNGIDSTDNRNSASLDNHHDGSLENHHGAPPSSLEEEPLQTSLSPLLATPAVDSSHVGQSPLHQENGTVTDWPAPTHKEVQARTEEDIAASGVCVLTDDANNKQHKKCCSVM